MWPLSCVPCMLGPENPRTDINKVSTRPGHLLQLAHSRARPSKKNAQKMRWTVFIFLVVEVTSQHVSFVAWGHVQCTWYGSRLSSVLVMAMIPSDSDGFVLFCYREVGRKEHPFPTTRRHSRRSAQGQRILIYINFMCPSSCIHAWTWDTCVIHTITHVSITCKYL